MTQAAAPTRRTPMIVGRVLSGLAIVFLALDAAGKLFAPAQMIANSPSLGIPPEIGFYHLLGVILAISTLLYAIPRTAVLGAVLYLRDRRVGALFARPEERP